MPWPRPAGLDADLGEIGLLIPTEAMPHLLVIQAYSQLGLDGVPNVDSSVELVCATGDMVDEASQCFLDPTSGGFTMGLLVDSGVVSLESPSWIAVNVSWAVSNHDASDELGSFWATWLLATRPAP